MGFFRRIIEKNQYFVVRTQDDDYVNSLPKVESTYVPQEPMPVDYTQALPSCTWGMEKWGNLFSDRQAYIINQLKDSIISIKEKLDKNQEYDKAVITYLTFLLDRIIVRYTEFGVWHILQETVEHPFGRQAIPMKFSYPASTNSRFSTSTIKSLSPLATVLVVIAGTFSKRIILALTSFAMRMPSRKRNCLSS